MDGWMDGSTEAWMYGYKDVRMDKRIDEWVDGWLDEWVDRTWMGRCVNRNMDEWTIESMDG